MQSLLLTFTLDDSIAELSEGKSGAPAAEVEAADLVDDGDKMPANRATLPTEDNKALAEHQAPNTEQHSTKHV